MKNYGVRSDLFRLIIKISDDYDKKYMQIKFNLVDKSRLKMIETQSMIIVVHENSCFSKK